MLMTIMGKWNAYTCYSWQLLVKYIHENPGKLIFTSIMVKKYSWQSRIQSEDYVYLHRKGGMKEGRRRKSNTWHFSPTPPLHPTWHLQQNKLIGHYRPSQKNKLIHWWILKGIALSLASPLRSCPLIGQSTESPSQHLKQRSSLVNHTDVLLVNQQKLSLPPFWPSFLLSFFLSYPFSFFLPLFSFIFIILSFYVLMIVLFWKCWASLHQFQFNQQGQWRHRCVPKSKIYVDEIFIKVSNNV